MLVMMVGGEMENALAQKGLRDAIPGHLQKYAVLD
jgi:hypothetical protein